MHRYDTLNMSRNTHTVCYSKNKIYWHSFLFPINTLHPFFPFCSFYHLCSAISFSGAPSPPSSFPFLISRISPSHILTLKMRNYNMHAQHFYYPFISWRTFKFFYFLDVVNRLAKIMAQYLLWTLLISLGIW